MSLSSVVVPGRVPEHGGCKELLESDVKNAKVLTRSIPLHDYSPAVQGALSWLGKRYLLAEPVNRRGEDRKAVGEPQRGQLAPFGAMS